MTVGAPRSGDRIGGFTLGPLVHHGGTALLFEATHPGHATALLVKIACATQGEEPAAIGAFEMERMILPRLAGPHVPRCLGAGHEPVPWIAMERAPAPSLRPLLVGLPLPPGRVARIGAKVADALDGLHRQNVAHLGLTPSHILLDDAEAAGRAVLLDFGLSHHAHLPDLLAGEFRLPAGSAPHMAPEQVMGLRGGPASDLFALGTVLYLLATGSRPFGDPRRLSGLRRRVWWDPPPPRALNPAVPGWLQELIVHCLEVEPAGRPASAAQLALLLRHPEQVTPTARAAKLARDPPAARLRRRFHPAHRPRLHRAP